MGIREIIAARKQTRTVAKSVPGLGDVIIRRIGLEDRLKFPEDARYGACLVAATACDEAGELLYTSIKEAGEDLGVFDALFAACKEVNSLDVEAAGKS
jgi:hypothetical protein